MNNPVIDKNGNKHWYNEKGKLHRLDGPAREWANGDKEWWVNGKCHRLDGPAVEWVNGYKEWSQNGKKLTKEEFEKQKSIESIELQPIINRFEALMDELND